jgi:hypothetical protein
MHLRSLSIRTLVSNFHTGTSQRQRARVGNLWCRSVAHPSPRRSFPLWNTATLSSMNYWVVLCRAIILRSPVVHILLGKKVIAMINQCSLLSILFTSGVTTYSLPFFLALIVWLLRHRSKDFPNITTTIKLVCKYRCVE